MSRRPTFPSMRLHKPSGRAVVTVRLADGRRKDIYLGPWESEEAAREYKRLIAELAAGSGTAPAPVVAPSGDVTIVELVALYREHVVRHYRRPDGTPTGQGANIRDALRPLLELYGDLPAREFGPLALDAVRGRMIRAGLARGTINARVGLIRAFFRWCVSRELLPVTVAQALAAVQGLQAGRSDARETAPVRPPAAEHIDAVLPFLPPHVAALVRLQLLTSARAGELVRLKAIDIDRSAEPWVIRLKQHKTAHRGKSREVLFGPAAREVLAPLILKAGGGYLFSPARSEAARNAARSEARVVKLWPSHVQRNQRKRAPGDVGHRESTTPRRRTAGRSSGPARRRTGPNAKRLGRSTPHSPPRTSTPGLSSRPGPRISSATPQPISCVRSSASRSPGRSSATARRSRPRSTPSSTARRRPRRSRRWGSGGGASASPAGPLLVQFPLPVLKHQHHGPSRWQVQAKRAVKVSVPASSSAYQSSPAPA